jgi:pyruvate/2-oxoglutarate dehydrogenase complex dihydrolipoamide acyltransferase (E2) component
MAYLAQQRILVGSTGDKWEKDEQIGDLAIAPDLRERLLAEGAIVPLASLPAHPEPLDGESEEALVVDLITDRAQAIAEEHGLDWQQYAGQGSGDGGRLLVSDVRELIAAQAAIADDEALEAMLDAPVERVTDEVVDGPEAD